jgi:hypothetical protein
VIIYNVSIFSDLFDKLTTFITLLLSYVISICSFISLISTISTYSIRSITNGFIVIMILFIVLIHLFYCDSINESNEVIILSLSSTLTSIFYHLFDSILHNSCFLLFITHPQESLNVASIICTAF